MSAKLRELSPASEAERRRIRRRKRVRELLDLVNKYPERFLPGPCPFKDETKIPPPQR